MARAPIIPRPSTNPKVTKLQVNGLGPPDTQRAINRPVPCHVNRPCPGHGAITIDKGHEMPSGTLPLNKLEHSFRAQRVGHTLATWTPSTTTDSFLSSHAVISRSRLSITISLCALNPSTAICFGLIKSQVIALPSDFPLVGLLSPSSLASEAAEMLGFFLALASATATGSKCSPAW
ncbi:unnamed protein product [Striga asiatica]|uniref:Uncharacterized protein n=1 Tax=Striga asiatica TaxID=4170 RepID=A0A5A7P7K3_STRAF|nr:unnamed protein product [Striga asiatica]